MTLRPVALPEVPDRLFLAAMPGRADPLREFVAATAVERVGHILCLAGAEEIAKTSPDYAALLASGDAPWDWHTHPIADFGIPDDLAPFATRLSEMAMLLRGGERIALHCAAGVGRTGTAATCLLLMLGLGRAEADARIRAAGSHPETPEQRAFVDRFRG